MPADPKKLKHADFEKLELRVGTIKAAKDSGIKGEYVLAIDLGPAERDIQVVADLKEGYEIDELIGKQVVVLCNIASEKVGEYESTAMLLIAHKDGKQVLIGPEKETLPGVQVSGIMDSTCTHFAEEGK